MKSPRGVQNQGRFGHLIFMKTEQTQPADEDHVTQPKAPEQVIN